MPTALGAPLYRLLALVGSGHVEQPVTDLAGLGRRLDELAADVDRIGRQLRDSWNGAAATAAGARLDRLSAAIRALADHVDALSADLETAGRAVERVRAELEQLIADFEARAETLTPAVPGAAAALADEAHRAHGTAAALVDGLRGTLAGAAGGLGATAAPFTGFSAPAGAGPVSPDAVPTARYRDMPTPEAAEFGSGAGVRLPDGTSVTAPNAVAADAVRHALTQLGVPYQWGGTTAGVGLDCSGLTQWAYREAGLTLPRLAQEQDIGAAVDAGSLRPGDLAVWDGHVAMIVGNGAMIEAGDPVQLSPIRTTNAGQGFQGFWRPTA